MEWPIWVISFHWVAGTLHFGSWHAVGRPTWDDPCSGTTHRDDLWDPKTKIESLILILAKWGIPWDFPIIMGWPIWMISFHWIAGMLHFGSWHAVGRPTWDDLCSGTIHLGRSLRLWDQNKKLNFLSSQMRYPMRLFSLSGMTYMGWSILGELRND